MSFGLLQIPTQFTAGEPTGDPVLLVILDFAQTILNHYCSDAFRVVVPNSVPVKKVFPFWPSKDLKFSDKDLPALFLEREHTEPTEQIGGDLVVARSSLRLLWIYPSGSTEALKRTSPFWNAIDKTLRATLEVGKDRSWVVPGDTYYSPEFWGSSLLYHTQCMRIAPGRTLPERIDIEFEGQRKTDAGGYLGASMRLTITERSVPDSLRKIVPLTNLELTVTGNADTSGPLALQVATFGLRLNLVTPNAGPAAGGTAVTLTGLSFTALTKVTVGGIEVEPTLVSLTEMEIVTPAHAVGAVEIVLTNPGDETVTAPNAFTFT